MIAQLQKTLFILFAIYVTTFFVSSTEIYTPAITNPNAYLNIDNSFTGEAWSNNDNNFEGIITQINSNVYDTVKNIYYVTSTAVRVDVINKYDELKNTFIFDLYNEISYVVDYNKEMYKVYKSKNSPLINSDLQLKVSNSNKSINNYNCYLWRIVDNTTNTEISYWVNGKSFNFYSKVLNLWNRKENRYKFFMNLANNKGILPMHIIERTNLREIISESKIIKIDNVVLDESVVTIPDHFKAI